MRYSCICVYCIHKYTNTQHSGQWEHHVFVVTEAIRSPCSAGSPFDGKASDMWAMGVLFYTMLYGQFPFYDSNPQELFKRISEAEYTIPK